ncbi:aldo/keto reductase [Acutalibacter intestini]|uniref:aldo/keto reductase n=1 Tax=Acutalibacter intestini TaxID=3093659 RepID=UPI002AC8CB70|nr:aldo/keto reductase [Acutalibacter sp. M00204]
MKQLSTGGGTLKVPAIALGCMRINSLNEADAQRLIHTALENGINFFDHADIYGGGEAERFFAKAAQMTPALREKMILQSKCSIHPGVSYDCSKEYILSSVEGILERLNTEYLDVLLLHRPDALMDPAEVAEAFDALEASGKVRHFGVSNQNPGQIALLQKYCKQPLLFNQLQLSVTNCGMIDAGLNVNTESPLATDRDGGVLDFCRLHDITIQAWSPFQYGMFQGTFLGCDKFPELNQKIDEIAEKYGITNNAVAVAWILRHPAGIQTIVGTTNAQRLADVCKASEITLSRTEWYELYCAAGKSLP